MQDSNVNRRDFNRLTAAALGGMLSAGVAGCTPESGPGPTPAVKTPEPAAVKTAPEAPKAPPPGTENLAMGEKHLCRGLNACKGLGGGEAAGKNDCAGKGECATVEHHACGGHNDCKGFGGCGSTAGRNECKEKGGCHVPLMEDAWKDVRKLFEERMQADGKKFGAAPEAKKEKQEG